MIKIVAKMLVKEGEVEHFKEIAKELVQKSSAEEGNISYTLNASISDPRVLTFIEFWKDQAAIEAHNASEHFRRIVPLTQALCEDASVDLYTELDL